MPTFTLGIRNLFFKLCYRLQLLNKVFNISQAA